MQQCRFFHNSMLAVRPTTLVSRACAAVTRSSSAPASGPVGTRPNEFRITAAVLSLARIGRVDRNW